MTEVLPENDKSIADDAWLWRRIPPEHIVPGDEIGTKRPSSAAFDENPDGTDLSMILDVGQDPGTALIGHPTFSLVKVQVALIRELGFGVKRVPEENDPNHVEITGNNPRTKPLVKKRRKLSRAAVWVVGPAVD